MKECNTTNDILKKGSLRCSKEDKSRSIKAPSIPPEAKKLISRIQDHNILKEFSKKVYNKNRDRYLNKLGNT